MAYIQIKDYQIKGVSAAVPKKIINNSTLDILGNEEEKQKFLQATHIQQRRVVGESGITSSDLCLAAAKSLLETSGIAPSLISVLIFVTQTPDYQLPSTAIILQDKLDLSKDCIAIQVSLGCSGWVIGLSTALTYLNAMHAAYGLVLVGDTVTMTKSSLDKSTFPLFGDAGTATLLERKVGATGFKFQIGNDGSGHRAIIIEDGGYRNPVSLESFKMKERENGVIRNSLQSYLNGDAVFIFGITKAPSSIKSLMQQFSLNEAEIDYLLLHQANKMMNDKIIKKVGFPSEKVPFSLHEFGNTSSASIPLTMVTQLPALTNGLKKHIACGFGVGLSWASVYFETSDLIIPELIILS
jgi:3-oxoacyl-[acyl-carrier-protein] synthase-3